MERPSATRSSTGTFRNSRWIHNPAATEERQRFDAVVDLFKKYSEQYDFDYLMMVAQGYQESRLDQNARSHVGAIGIMQLMPATAAGSPVFIPDVSTAEANIHAGVKYMRYLMDHYFADPEIDEVNRYLLAFAAYNAGPNRIARLRALAPEYGCRSQPVVQEHAVRGGQQGLAGARALRRQHLQVLPGVPTTS